MKKPKSDESPKLKKCASNLQSEILKKRINKKDKEEKNTIKKKVSKEKINKSKKKNVTENNNNKKKTIEIPNNTAKNKKLKITDKKIIKKSLSKKKLKNSLSQKNLGKIKSKKYNLSQFNASNASKLENKRSDSPNDLLTGSDNFVQSLLMNYLDGTDNLINEVIDPFINLENNDEMEKSSFINENNENGKEKEKEKENKTSREYTDINRSFVNKEEKKNESNINDDNTISKSHLNTSINLNSTKIKKDISKIRIKKDNVNKTKTDLSKTLMISPSRMRKGRLSFRAQTSINIFKKGDNNETHNKKSSLNSQKKENVNNNEIKESNLKRKILYSNKIINGLNKSKQNNKGNDNEQKKKETIPVSTSSFNLDVIFENRRKSKVDMIPYHYLENTVSAKNKMVQKKEINSFDQSKNDFSSFSKIGTICVCDKNANPIKTKIFRINRTPKIKKDFKKKDGYLLNSFNNNINSSRNYIRKNSFNISRELTNESNIPRLLTMTNANTNTKNFNRKLDDYLITKELGKGSYAVVKLAVHKITRNKYAIKIYSKQTLIDPQKRNTVKNEINILKQIDNENVMKLYEVIDTPSNLYLVQEYINGVNLLEILKNEKNHYIKEQRAKKLFTQIVKGISYCHKKNIFHRDIKLENILVLKDDTIKIIDFGFGIKCNRDTLQKLFCGTPSYMAPEIVKKEKYIACYSDIWSLGVLFYAILFGIFPFKGKDDDELFEKINEANLVFPEYNPLSEKIKQMIQKIFVHTPNQRITLDEMINILNEE